MRVFIGRTVDAFRAAAAFWSEHTCLNLAEAKDEQRGQLKDYLIVVRRHVG